jgi:outer membrane protein
MPDMKKGLLFAAALTFSCFSFADGVAFSLGAYSWKTEASGGIKTPDVDFIDLSIDTFDTAKQNQSVYFLTFEHPIRFLPNIKLSYSDLRQNAYNGRYIYASNVFNIGQGAIDLSHTDITAYYNIVSSAIKLDLGATARFFDGEFALQNITLNGSQLNNTTSPLDNIIGLIYVKASAELPYGFSVEAETNIGQYGDDEGFDATALLSYRSPIGLGVAGGYRSFQSTLNSKVQYEGFKTDLSMDLTFKGPMFYIFYSF